MRTGSWDGWTRRSLLDRPRLAVPDRSVAVVDGAMLLAEPELDGLWDLRIWVYAATNLRRERMVIRDALWADDPNPDALRRQFDSRYRPDEDAYERARRPDQTASWSGSRSSIQTTQAGSTAEEARQDWCHRFRVYHVCLALDDELVGVRDARGDSVRGPGEEV